MRSRWFIVFYVGSFIVSCGCRHTSLRVDSMSTRSVEKEEQNNRSKYQLSLKQQTKQINVQKRQVSYRMNGVQHVFERPRDQNLDANLKPMDLPQPGPHQVIQPPPPSIPDPYHDQLIRQFGGPQRSDPDQDRSAVESEGIPHHMGEASPSELGLSRDNTNTSPQEPEFSAENQEPAIANSDESLHDQMDKNISPVPQHSYEESQSSDWNPGGDLSNSRSEGPPLPTSNQGPSTVSTIANSDEPLHDHMDKNISPVAQQSSDWNPGGDVSNSRSEGPPLVAPNQDPSIVNTGEPLNIHMVKKFYPVEIVQKVPRPIPVTHTKLVPIPVHQRKYRYYSQPFPRLFSRQPDVHLSYLHLDRRANPCQHGGIIVQSPGGYTCLCRKAYKGKHCQERDRCYPYPCQNDGDCIDHGTHYECKCTSGFKGINCDVKDKCYKHPCKNGGTCVQLLSDVKCTCSAGYKGQFCQDLDYCHPNPCRNGGTCHEVNQEASCTCTPSYKGPRCQVPKTCSPNLCRNGGVCVEEKPSSPCQCAAGFTGYYCSENVCQPNPCQNGGICYPAKSDYNSTWNAACKCRETYKGDWCQIANPCASNPGPCVHGICYDSYTSVEKVDIPTNGFTCQCYEGYFGTYCRDKKCDNCDANARCLNGQCVCNNGYQGDGHSCKKIPNLCVPNPCENGGTCVSDYSSFECKCAPGFKGKTCRGKTPCSGLDNPCKNGGTCIEEGDSYRCICPPEVKGRDCSDNSTNLCTSQPCLNGGVCKVAEDNKSWYCICKGTRFKPPDCACNCPTNAIGPSERNLTCDNPEGLCVCPRGLKHDHNRDVCVDQETDRGKVGKAATSCNPNPCRNGATCVTLSYAKFLCTCPKGWTGKLCDEEDPIGRGPTTCEPNPCKNGGTCGISNGTAVCTCPQGFKPPFCDGTGNTSCLPNPCHNNGQCITVGQSYDCICNQQFTGPNCEVDRCLKCDPLNALCVSGKCICKTGFVGNGYHCLRKKKAPSNVCIKCHPVYAMCVNNNCHCKDGYVGNGYQCTAGYSNNQQIPWFKRSLGF